MIKSFYIHNFKSIKDLTVDLAYNTEPLSEVLSPNEIGVLSYSKKEGTVLTRVSQIKALKSSEDLRHRYVRGDFGGIPFPYI